MSHEQMLEYYHNKGQEDYPEWDPPSSSGIVMLTGRSDFDWECIAAYRQGWENAQAMDES